MKKTGGGTFDPAARPVYFAAGTNWTGGPVRWPAHVLVAVNDILKPADEHHLTEHLDNGRRVLLDSGIFWLTNQHKRAHGVTMDQALALPPEEIDGFAELYDRYTEVVTRFGDRLWGWIELDQGGAVNKRLTRARIEADTGNAPIPVYHPLNDGWDYFDELASQYDRICVGNIVQAPRPARIRILHTIWERHRAYPDLWVHVLGLTANEWCLAARPDSCDSSTWLSPLRWPAVRTESALLRKTADLRGQFSYDIGNPDSEGATRSASFGMCSDAVTAMNRTWAHADTATGVLLGQPPCPPRLPNEKPPSP